MTARVTNMSPGQRAERYFANEMLKLERAGFETREDLLFYMQVFDRWERAQRLLRDAVAPISLRELKRRLGRSGEGDSC